MGDAPQPPGPVEGAPPAAYDQALIRRLVGFGRVAAELGLAENIAGVSEAVCSHAAAVLGADAASLAQLVDDDTLELIAARGSREASSARWARFAVSDANPASEAVRTGSMVSVAGRAALRERYPTLFSDEVIERSVVSLPLRVAGRCVGVVSLAFAGMVEVDDADRQFLQALADTSAQALARLTANRIAGERAAQLSFLVEASAALASSLDFESTLQRVATLAVPVLADWCAIDMLDDGILRPVAVAHVDPAKIALAAQLRERYPTDMDDPSGAPAVARTGRSELYSHIPEELLEAGARDEEHLRLIRELKLRSALIVPLAARGRTLGVLTLIAAESDRSYTEVDVRFAEEVARRAGVAIDNAQVHSQTLQASLQLQRAVLPASFPPTPPWQVGVHYRPAGRTEVGGDFYDAVALKDDRLVVFVGDVMGRGVVAAAAMAQMRASLRAYVALDPAPVTVVERLSLMFDTYELTQLVTVLIGVIDPRTDSVELVSAGHLPPLVVRDDGRVERLVVPSSPPLGAGRFARSRTTAPFTAGDTLLLFTDGLVERRDEDIDTSLDRLTAAVTALGGELGDAALSELADNVCAPGHDDDVTMIAIHRTS